MAIPASGMERYSTALTNLVSKLGIGILHPSSFSSLSVGIGVGTGGGWEWDEDGVWDGEGMGFFIFLVGEFNFSGFFGVFFGVVILFVSM